MAGCRTAYRRIFNWMRGIISSRPKAQDFRSNLLPLVRKFLVELVPIQRLRSVLEDKNKKHGEW